ncbi:hypothetical protein MEG05_14400 [Vibrio aestuarianus]|nr:hypothetical protein [Vibrio aestuarianus]MDE1315279.1 hypothetical protein [Vibrio aestuarianus]
MAVNICFESSESLSLISALSVSWLVNGSPAQKLAPAPNCNGTVNLDGI